MKLLSILCWLAAIITHAAALRDAQSDAGSLTPRAPCPPSQRVSPKPAGVPCGGAGRTIPPNRPFLYSVRSCSNDYRYCFRKCNADIRCSFFAYNRRTNRCRIYEGDTMQNGFTPVPGSPLRFYDYDCFVGQDVTCTFPSCPGG